MQLLRTIEAFRSARADLSGSVGFVPTMGYLHAGHMALVKRARDENETLVVSIFVNPKQFDKEDDLARYPRDLARDRAMLEEAGVDLLFVPEGEEIYPDSFVTSVHVEELTSRLEGAHRMGHFDGVATVLTKLFNIVQPTRTYFGQKDAQQLVVVRRLVEDLNFPIEVVAVPTVRERDGLALSSRNVLLEGEARLQALALSQALNTARVAWDAGERDADVLRATALTILRDSSGVETDYVSLADPDTLEELSGRVHAGLLSIAVWVGEVRLIDNVLLKK